MGVAGLWDVLKPAAKVRSLTDLAIREGFQANPEGKRGFRLGIDASIWFFHAEYGREGENPVLRTLFFRCATLMKTTFLPIFVFDGPKRPDVKRGKKINRTGHKLIPGMKQIVEAFGFEWRMAPGEAEAELAYLNRIGVIDAILSDDVDNFLFGATTVIRNSSNTLSGNRANPILNSVGKDDKNHTRIFRMQDITNHPEVRLTRGGTILIGLMSGGDYQQGGIMRCGVTTAHGLAKCGFGDTLFEAAMNLDRESLEDFLVAWRHELCQELRTNSKKEIGRKQLALAKSIPQDFPDIDILLSYVKPITSESMGRENNNLKLTWGKEPDLAKLAATCEFYFEWGYKEAIIKRFRTVIWPSVVLRILRRAALDRDEGVAPNSKASRSANTPTTPRKKGKETKECGTPSKMITKHFSCLGLATPSKVYISGSESEDEDDEENLILKIHSKREHPSTDGLLEYRLEIAPKQLVRLAEEGIQGIRVPEGPDEWASEDEDDDGGDDEEGGRKKKKGKKPPVDPEEHLRLWMPACMVQIVEPRLVKEYEDMSEARAAKKAKKGTRAAPNKDKEKEKTPATKKRTVADAPVAHETGEDVFSAQVTEKPKPKKTTAKAKAKATAKEPEYPPLYDDDEGEQEYDEGLAALLQQRVNPQNLTRKTAGLYQELEESSDDDLPASILDLGRPSKPIHQPLVAHKPTRSLYEEADGSSEGDLPPTILHRKPTESRAPATQQGRYPSISSPGPKSRTGIRDLTKKKGGPMTTTTGLKSFFSVTHSATTFKEQEKHTARSVPLSQTTLPLPGRICTSSHPASHHSSASSSFSSKKNSCAGSSKSTRSGSSTLLPVTDDEEYDIGLWDENGKVAPSITVSPSKRRTLNDSLSGSELKESPRKKASQTSPQSHRRPLSPIQFTAPSKFNKVIEISTDSEDDSDGSPASRIVPLKTLPPLLAARARAASSQRTSSTTRLSKSRNPDTVTVDVIDLT